MTGLRVERVQAAALLLHFDESWAARVLDGDALGLTAAEKALFASVDRRGFRADAERQARAAAVVVEELPVSVAHVGVARVFAFFSSDAFVDVVLGVAPLVPRVADWLSVVPAQIEGAVARARRRRHAGALPGLSDGLCAAPGVAVAAGLPAGSLERFIAARARLAPDPVAAVGRGVRIEWPIAASTGPDDDDDAVLVTGGLVDPALSGCGAALAELVGLAQESCPRALLLACAQRHGCDADEARALLQELVGEGLLVEVV